MSRRKQPARPSRSLLAHGVSAASARRLCAEERVQGDRASAGAAAVDTIHLHAARFDLPVAPRSDRTGGHPEADVVAAVYGSSGWCRARSRSRSGGGPSAPVGRESDHRPATGSEDRFSAKEPKNQGKNVPHSSHGFPLHNYTTMRKRSAGIYFFAMVPDANRWVVNFRLKRYSR